MEARTDARAELMQIEWIDPRKLKENPKNRNKHSPEQIDRLAQIIKYQGWRFPVIADKNNIIWAGHGRVLAAKKLKEKQVPVSYQEFTNEEQAYAFLVSDNAIASWAELDLAGINSDIGELGPDFNIDLLGIKDFILEPAELVPQCDEDEVPEQVEAKSKLGDIYQLGRHRLMCGDSTSIDAVERLIAGERADMVFTDPPYGVNAVHNREVGVSGPTGWDKTTGEGVNRIYKARKYRPIIGDEKPFDPLFLIPLAEKVIMWGANYYSDKLPLGMKWLVWDKKGDGVGSDGNSFSDCELAWTNLKGRSIQIYRHLWSGLLRAGGRKEELTERVHPTQKPVGLNEQIIEAFTESTETILDLFGGSGSTLIACEKTKRRCFMMELDPHYVDVIVARWEKYTGKKAELLNGG